MTAPARQPHPDDLVLDRCVTCGRTLSDELVKYRDRRPCDRCDYTKLPEPWRLDEMRTSHRCYCPNCDYDIFIAEVSVDGVEGSIRAHVYSNEYCDDCEGWHLWDHIQDDVDILCHGNPVTIHMFECVDCGHRMSHSLLLF